MQVMNFKKRLVGWKKVVASELTEDLIETLFGRHL